MTVLEHLALPIDKRIERYRLEFSFGTQDPDLTHGIHCGIRTYDDAELHEYILYRLKREPFDLADAQKNQVEIKQDRTAKIKIVVNDEKNSIVVWNCSSGTLLNTELHTKLEGVRVMNIPSNGTLEITFRSEAS